MIVHDDSSDDARVTAVVQAFFDAADCAGQALSMRAVGTAWDEPSALPKMTVGMIAGHVLLVVRRLGQHLDDPQEVDGPPPGSASYEWMRVATPEDLDHLEHQVVRVDGDHVAAWGWESVKTSYVERVAGISERLARHTPTVVVLGGSTLPFDRYVETRIVELLVHADDLCVSVGLPGADLPASAAGIAIGTLTEAAREVHGDLAVLRALSRSERTPSTVPSVY